MGAAAGMIVCVCRFVCVCMDTAGSLRFTHLLLSELTKCVRTFVFVSVSVSLFVCVCLCSDAITTGHSAPSYRRCNEIGEPVPGFSTWVTPGILMRCYKL